jgi:hypothetical protein
MLKKVQRPKYLDARQLSLSRKIIFFEFRDIGVYNNNYSSVLNNLEKLHYSLGGPDSLVMFLTIPSEGLTYYYYYYMEHLQYFDNI